MKKCLVLRKRYCVLAGSAVQNYVKRQQSKVDKVSKTVFASCLVLQSE